MFYEIEIKPGAVKDCKKIPKEKLHQIYNKIETMKDGLKGDIKKLTNYSPEYRLRIGEYRVLFEIEHQKIVIYRIVHRRNAYQ